MKNKEIFAILVVTSIIMIGISYAYMVLFNLDNWVLALFNVPLWIISLLITTSIFQAFEERAAKRRNKRRDARKISALDEKKDAVRNSLDVNLNYWTREELIKQTLIRDEIQDRIESVEESILRAKVTIEEQTKYIQECEEVIYTYQNMFEVK